MTESLLSAIAALLFVIGLMFLMFWGVRKLGLVPGYAAGGKSGRKRIKILETKMLDPRNRLVLVSVDDREILLAASQNGVTLVSDRERLEDFSALIDDQGKGDDA